MSGHTPGPWVAEGFRIYGPLDSRSKHPNGRSLVGGVVDDFNDWRSAPKDVDESRSAFREETAANARLISAAPDLAEVALAFAEVGVDLTDAACHRGLCAVEACGRCSKVLRARAALQKAGLLP